MVCSDIDECFNFTRNWFVLTINNFRVAFGLVRLPQLMVQKQLGNFAWTQNSLSPWKNRMEPAICLFRAWAFLDMQSTIRQVNMSQVFHQGISQVWWHVWGDLSHKNIPFISPWPGLVNIQKTMENHHVQRVNPLSIWSNSIALLVITRGYNHTKPPFWFVKFRIDRCGESVGRDAAQVGRLFEMPPRFWKPLWLQADFGANIQQFDGLYNIVIVIYSIYIYIYITIIDWWFSVEDCGISGFYQALAWPYALLSTILGVDLPQVTSSPN